jgi:spore photoproduct lyase
MFKPKTIFFEKEIENYELGKQLMQKYKDLPKIEIANHNNIEQMRMQENKEFLNMKRNLIIGVRKTHKFVENHKVSDYLVPYTSSGCTAACMYCYLVCNYNKCSYLRLFVNREQMLEKIIKTAEKSDRELTFEIGSNSDLILENTITGNLPWTIENFKSTKKGMLTFPTKFNMVDDILNVDHQGKVIARMSVNPDEIIKQVELGTSRLKERIEAINKLKEAGYKIGILIAPVIMVENWKNLYL